MTAGSEPSPPFEPTAREGRGRAMPANPARPRSKIQMPNTIDLRGLVRPQLVEATKREDNPNVAEFRLQPLERGFGHTLGNSMRRMLLSSLRGAAVWAFRIDGVVHEHQTIPGVVEDVVLHISKSEAGAVTAADINASGGVRIVDGGHHLFTLQDDRDLNV